MFPCKKDKKEEPATPAGFVLSNSVWKIVYDLQGTPWPEQPIHFLPGGTLTIENENVLGSSWTLTGDQVSVSYTVLGYMGTATVSFTGTGSGNAINGTY